MTEMRHHLSHICDNQPVWDGGSVDHDDLKPKRACRLKFRQGPLPSGVLGDHPVDAMGLQKRTVILSPKRPARDNDIRIGQDLRSLSRIHKPQKVVVLRGGSECANLLPANGKENATRRVRQGTNGGGRIRHMGPIVSGSRNPRRAFKGCKFHALRGASRHGIGAHGRGERMRGVNDLSDPIVTQESPKPLYSAKPSDPGGQRGALWFAGSTSIRIDRIGPDHGKRVCQVIGLTGAAEQKDAHRV